MFNALFFFCCASWSLFLAWALGIADLPTWALVLTSICVGISLAQCRILALASAALKSCFLPAFPSLSPSLNSGGYAELDHKFLNITSTSSWMNLGLWQQLAPEVRLQLGDGQPVGAGVVGSDWKEEQKSEVDHSTQRDYPTACAALATMLGRAAGIQPGERILDVGFGRGDQLFLWRDVFKAQWVCGVNASMAEVEFCRNRLVRERKAHSSPNRDRISVVAGSATALRPALEVLQDEDGAPLASSGGFFDRVLALDCAYHFAPSREAFFQDAFSVLKPGGRLALTDIIAAFDTSTLTTTRSLLLRLLCRLTGLPFANICNGHVGAYKEALTRAGFSPQSIQIIDISSSVFPGFADWVQRHCDTFQGVYTPDDSASFLAMQKLRLTARLSASAAASGAIQFVLVTATRPSR